MERLQNNSKYSRKYSLETQYNGIVFRSRLEARWAIYFDIIGAKYEYENEGYKLENGICYRPDFLLTNIKGRSSDFLYVEVKCFLTQEDRYKIWGFSKPIIVLGNIPESAWDLYDQHGDSDYCSYLHIDCDSYPCAILRDSSGNIVYTGGDHGTKFDDKFITKALQTAKYYNFYTGEIDIPKPKKISKYCQKEELPWK